MPLKLAHRTTLIKESPTFAVIAQANKLKAAGHDVIILAAGEPDFDTPDHIKDAAIVAIKAGKTKYTAVGGLLQLREAIVNKFAHENNLEYGINEVLVSAGGKHSIYNTLQAIIDDGDEVITPAPYWVSYPDMVLLAGGTPVFVACPIEDCFKMTATKLEQYITSKTKAVILNSPSNPTGMVYTRDEMVAIANVLRKYPDIYIISDDIYEHMIFNDAQKFYNIVNVAPDLSNRTIVINGVSKSYAMTGWRIGYAACNNAPLIKAMENIQSQSTSNPCSIAQYAAIAALNGGLDCVIPMRKAFIERHKYVVNQLNSIRGIRCLEAQGAFYAFFDCTQAIDNMYDAGKITEKTDLALATYLLNEAFVAFVPGSAFGMVNYMRLSFATSMGELTRALERVAKVL